MKPGGKPSGPPRSRNTTPLPPGSSRVSAEPASSSSSYFRSSVTHLAKDSDISLEELLDSNGSASHIPSASQLMSMRESIKRKVLEHVKERNAQSDKVLRELQKMRSHRSTHDIERENRRGENKEDTERKNKVKKSGKRDVEEEQRPLAHGAHAVAKQDGTDANKGEDPFQIFRMVSVLHLGAILLLFTASGKHHSCSPQPLALY